MNYRRGKTYSHILGHDLTSLFLAESKKLLHMEQGAKSIMTVQALSLLFAVEVGLGRDRAGLVYRYSSYDMLKCLGLENEYHQLEDGEHSQARRKQVISKLCWGLFASEWYVELSTITTSKLIQLVLATMLSFTITRLLFPNRLESHGTSMPMQTLSMPIAT